MLCVSVREQTDISEARRRAAVLASNCGLDETAAGRLAIVVTELATNIVRHAGGGDMLLEGDDGWVQALALDKGPGIANVSASMIDGVSTGGTRGEGLGAVARQADAFDIYSAPGLGVAALARVGSAPQGDGIWAGVNIPYPGETVSGDAWAARLDDDVLTLMVADGLGHGLLAHEAAKAAVAVFLRHGSAEPSQLLDLGHRALRATRGAAVSVARLGASGVTFSGIGNVAGVLVGDGVKKMISHNGTLGHVARRFQSFDYPSAAPYLVVMYSDGIGSNWSLDRYPGLVSAHPALVAGVLHRDFSRGRDDATVLVARGLAR